MRTQDVNSTVLVQDALSECNDGRIISDIELLQLHLNDPLEAQRAMV